MKQTGFSLLELLVVMGILSLILVITVPSFAGIRSKNAFLDESRTLVDLLLDARANAISGKVCEIDGESVQSNGWAVRVTKDSSGDQYYSQLLCRNFEPVACIGSDPDCGAVTPGVYDINWYPQYVFEYTPTSGDVMDRYKNILTESDRMDRVGVIGMTPFDNGPTDQYTATLAEKELALVYQSPSAPSAGLKLDDRIDYNWFQLMYSDNTGQSIFTIDPGGSSGVLAQNYDEFFYIFLEKDSLQYSTTVNHQGATHPYGICMDTRKTFPVIPCRLTAEIRP